MDALWWRMKFFKQISKFSMGLEKLKIAEIYGNVLKCIWHENVY